MRGVIIDVTNTSRVNSNTGIQKLTREFFYELKKYFLVTPVCFDPILKVWRGLNKFEEVNLDLNNSKFKIKSNRGVKSQSTAIGKGLIKSGLGFKEQGDLFISTEIFKKDTILNLKKLRESYTFKKTLVVLHDSIPLTLPNLAHNKLYFYFFKYIRYLLSFNLILSVSQSSILKLIFLYKKNYININSCLFLVLNPGTSYYAKPNVLSMYGNSHVVAISSLEKRKNYVTLLKTFLFLWQNNYKTKLVLVGGLVNDYSLKIKRILNVLIGKKYPIIFFNSLSEKKLLYVYNKVNMLVYPSITEGFGIPIAENTSFRNVVITGRGGSLVNSNRGGFLRLNKVDFVSLAKIVVSVLKNDPYLFYIKNKQLSLGVYGWSSYMIQLLYKL